MRTSNINGEFYGTMVGTQDVGMDLGTTELVVEGSGGDKIVDTPAGILLASLEAVGPPGVDAFLVGIEIAEGVGKAGSQQVGELGAFFVGKAGIAAVGLGVLEVDFLMGHVQVPTEDDGFLGFQLLDVGQESFFPRHAVIQTAEFVLRIGHIDSDEVEMLHLKGNDTAFVVVLIHSYSIGNRQGLVTGKDSSARIAFLFGIVPIGLITGELEVELSGLHLGFLQAEEVGIEFVKYISEAFVATGAKAVYIP